MNNRDTILSAQFPPATTTQPFLELDLRDLYTDVRLGRRGQLQVMIKLVQTVQPRVIAYDHPRAPF
jgi:hypothetical protein